MYGSCQCSARGTSFPVAQDLPTTDTLSQQAAPPGLGRMALTRLRQVPRESEELYRGSSILDPIQLKRVLLLHCWRQCVPFLLDRFSCGGMDFFGPRREHLKRHESVADVSLCVDASADLPGKNVACKKSAEIAQPRRAYWSSRCSASTAGSVKRSNVSKSGSSFNSVHWSQNTWI